ncbi:MAG: hypothetical protein GKS06_04080 [Acidobacteria bacterium]|nr:hypothetical protein [Acidobacteriota bacterium]
MNRGYLSLAAGDRRYLEMAVDWALSIRARTRDPIAVAFDQPLAGQARSELGAVFDDLVEIPARYLRGRFVRDCAVKFCMGEISPFEETVFIDSDCLLIADPAPPWNVPEDAKITMIGQLVGRDSQTRHHGFVTGSLVEKFHLDRYFQCSSGIIHFRSPGAAALFRECATCHETEVVPTLHSNAEPNRRLGSEIATAVVGGRRRFDSYSQRRCYWRRDVAELDPSFPPSADSARRLPDSGEDPRTLPGTGSRTSQEGRALRECVTRDVAYARPWATFEPARQAAPGSTQESSHWRKQTGVAPNSGTVRAEA